MGSGSFWFGSGRGQLRRQPRKGLSEAGGDLLRCAYAVHPIAAVQTEYSLWTRDAETDVIGAMRELGV
jgi:aryl-alcohol dehydrogenase-like predicted oxidoreductase